MAGEPNNFNNDPNKPHVDADSFGKQYEQQKEAVAEKTGDELLREKQQQKKQKKVGIKTYRDYASEELRKGGGSLTKMIIKEREREREQKRHSVKNSKNLLMTFLAILFIVIGIGIVGLSFVLVSQKKAELDEKSSIVITPDPLLINDFRKEIYIPKPTKSKLIRATTDEVEETSIPIGAVKHIYFVEDNSDGFKELIDTTEFMRLLEAKVPGSLYRTLDSNFMYGVHSRADGNSPFMIFKVSSYSTAYSAILTWEASLARDFEDIFNRDFSDTSRFFFEDIVLYNTDVRALLNDQGEVIFGYAFLQDKNTLVIFENKLSLREIITRMQRNTIKQ